MDSIGVKKQTGYSISNKTFQNLLYSDQYANSTKDILDFEEKLCAFFLKQYSLHNVFGADVVDAHNGGALYIEGISWPLKLLTLLLTPRVPDHDISPEYRIINLSIETSRLEPYISSFINIFGIDEYLDQCEPSHIQICLQALTHNFHNIAPFRFILKHSAGIFTDCLYQAYTEKNENSPRAFLIPIVLPTTAYSFQSSAKAMEKMCQMGLDMRNVTFHLRPPYLAGWHDYENVPLISSTAVINLAQIAYKAGKKRIGEFWQGVDEIFSIAIHAHLDRRRFFTGLAEGPMKPFFQSPWKEIYSVHKAGCFIEFAGLPESVLFLMDEGMECEDGWEIAVQTLAHLQELAWDATEKHNFPVMVVDYAFNTDAQETFWSKDIEKYGQIAKGFTEYTRGVHFPVQTILEPAQKIRQEGFLHRYVPSVTSLMPEFNTVQLAKLLQMAYEETDNIAVKIC